MEEMPAGPQSSCLMEGDRKHPNNTSKEDAGSGKCFPSALRNQARCRLETSEEDKQECYRQWE